MKKIIVWGVFIGLVVIAIILAIVYLSNQQKEECGLAVEYFISSNKSYILMINNFPNIEDKGVTDFVLPTCEEEKIYCFNSSYTEVLNEDGTIKEGIMPNTKFIVNLEETKTGNCVGNNCVHRKINNLEVCGG
ncbi:MAG: hypothetical protein AABY22_24580 [Nanoarchaeota archaeon]